MAAFAVSSYAQSSYRLGNKPFNPLLGETYESIREDRGWRFVSEQVRIFSSLLRNKPFELCHEKTNILHMRKQRRRSASQ